MHSFETSVRPLTGEIESVRAVFRAVLLTVVFLLLSVAAGQAQLAIAVTPESQSVEEGSHAFVDVVLSAQPDENVTLRSFRTSTKLSAPRPQTLVFTARNWNRPQSVRWWASADDDANDDEVEVWFFLEEDRDVYATARIRIEDDERPGNGIGICGARLGSLARNRTGEELDICWESGMEIPFDGEVVIETRRKSLWEDPFETFSPWREVGSGDRFTSCGPGNTCAQFTSSGLWRGLAMTYEMRIRRGEDFLAVSPELRVQAPNSDSAELNAGLGVRGWKPEWGPSAGRFAMSLYFTDPLVRVLMVELVMGLEASDFEVSNGMVTDVGYWESGAYKVVVEPAVLGEPVTVRLLANTVKGVGEGVSASGGNHYTRDNTASNVVVQQTVAPPE